MRKLAVILTVIVIVGGVVVWQVMDNKSQNSNNENSSEQKNDSGDKDSINDPIAGRITYTSNGFSVVALDLSVGGRIVVTNDSGNVLDFASDDHPTHTGNSELNVGIIQPGESKEFKISKAGTWGFHNHLNASHSGTISVQN